MGVTLPRPVMTGVLERDGSPLFRVGGGCINGFRENMEDAHITVMKETWGFFGVFDGHVNEHCSAYLEEAWKKELEVEGVVPMSDERMKEMALSIDKAFVDAQRDGGSTGTFFFATKKDNTFHLQVGNVGDSRILLGRGGKCISMTDDHKPTNEGERQRIESCGGHVESGRVDGSLAVSRAFGDRDYKQNNGNQLQQKVIALADVTHEDVVIGSDDFVVLACDGVFESNFTNDEVIEFVTKQLETEQDLAKVSYAVTQEAITRGSHDNISCVIVQFRDGTDFRRPIEVLPGPFDAPNHSGFRRMYKVMCEKAGADIATVLEQRYTSLSQKEDLTTEERGELDGFKDGPAKLTGDDRISWFREYYIGLEKEPDQQSQNDPLQRIQMLQQQMGVPLEMLLQMMGEAQGERDEQ